MKNMVLFPIRLTLFEKYFLIDTSKDFPMNIDGIFHLSGKLHREIFEEAVREVLKLHPLFLSKVEERKGTYFWVTSDKPFEIVWLNTPYDASRWDDLEPINLFESHSLELHVFSNNDETKIYYRIHHLCTDAAGFLRFIGDIFAEYSIRCGVDIRRAAPVEPQMLLDRDRYQIKESSGKIGTIQIVYETFKEIIKWLTQKPIPLIERNDTATTLSPFRRKTFVVSVEKVNEYRYFIKEGNCTLNDFLMTGLFVLLAKRDWQNIRRKKRENCLRIMLPVNMRWSGSEKIPAANIISYVFLTKYPEECTRSRNLLSCIHDEMQIIKDWQVGFIFFDALRFFNRFPGGLRRLTQNDRCLASLVWSNVGSIEKFFAHDFPRTENGKLIFGALQLEQCENYAPCRKHTNLSITVSVQAGELVLSCMYNQNFLSEENIDDMIHGLLEDLNNLSCKRKVDV